MERPSDAPTAVADLTAQTATTLARLIREGKCTSREVVEAHLQRIERINPVLNAVVTLNAEQARTDAAAADAALERGESVGPLHGVPITVKDGFATKGLRSTFGLVWYGRRLDRYEPPADAATVAALRAAGAIILGKTNLPFGSYDWQSNNPLFGRTNNPHDLARTPGGSSGGSAAAVAAGLSPLDLASDVAGSIRVPAHFCGVLSMRPTEGRVSTDGMMPPGHPGTLSHALTAGPVARCVNDLRLAHAVLTGNGGPSKPENQTSHPTARLDALRVAFSVSVGDAPVSKAVAQSVRSFASTLQRAGCTVEETAPPVDFEKAQRTWGLVHGFEFASGLPLGLGRPPLNKLFRLGLARLAFGPGSYSEALTRGYSAGARRYLQGLTERDRLVRSIQRFLSTWDVWMCPVAGRTAFPHCRTGADLTVDGTTVPYAAPLGVFNTGMALAGTPCVVLPVGTDRNGLPIGVQVHARRHDDARLLNIVDGMEKRIGLPDSSLLPVDEDTRRDAKREG
jgi:amidase